MYSFEVQYYDEFTLQKVQNHTGDCRGCISYSDDQSVCGIYVCIESLLSAARMIEQLLFVRKV